MDGILDGKGLAEKIQKQPLPEVKISEKNTPRGDNFWKKQTPEVKISEKKHPLVAKIWTRAFYSTLKCCLVALQESSFTPFHFSTLFHFGTHLKV